MSRRARSIVFAYVGQVLLQEWDPIGVRDEPRAQDEYDSYVPEIVQLLDDGADEAALVERLEEIETRRMGLPREERRRLASVANKMLSFYVEMLDGEAQPDR